MFRGSIVAIVTPFKDGRIDEESYRELIEFQIENGTSAIVPCGTTGESATLDVKEHDRVIDIAVEAVNKRVPVIAGTGGNSTSEAIALTEHAKKVGADATLQVTPYYNKPTQEGLYQHFKAIAKAVPLPQVLYNVPSRTGVNMLPETVARLAEIAEVVAIKEASGSIGQMAEIVKLAGDNITLLSGDDNLTLPVLAIGGAGVVSVVANIVPRDSADLVMAWEEGRVDEARELFYKLLPLCQAMFFETNPIPVKTALGLMGKIQDEMRLPLYPMAPANLEKLKKALSEYGLI
ncbi:MAG: 4-hydroxy-tetrahydrodipicolinate synthase [Desulfobacteraceae bacterium]|nr:4-hydroxy-tetrahydrodipicolinate synthase [Desulfobacterales bacterium]MBL6968581.1 4-hydroxy-tetrahydrodipicolinate synthase [Desulfobacteraceae bacterium]MBL7101739.1 4-hydroxy-tetrahydrodipicolinate synthase [Desulfobacteraceae bacterium]MBL7172616.1 4-hydroxy-tetrahydrodipicolinate synthase [Desulfobacteraceae bacterium]